MSEHRAMKELDLDHIRQETSWIISQQGRNNRIESEEVVWLARTILDLVAALERASDDA